MRRPDDSATRIHRRRFLKIGIVGGGLLAMGGYLSLGGEKNKSASQVWPQHLDHFHPNAWLCIDRDGSVTVRVNHSEMGQGITTALAMIVADALDVDWENVRAEIAPAESVYKNPEYHNQMTAGSTSVKTSWEPLQKAGATARQMLITAAANQWKVDSDACSTDKGVVVHAATGSQLRYGQLVDAASRLPVPETVRPKQTQTSPIIGKSLPRLDTIAKVTGQAVYGMDVRLPGLLHATVVHPPAIGTRLIHADSKAAKDYPGVRHVVTIASGIAVLADTFWQAREAAEALTLQWSAPSGETMSSPAISRRWKTLIKQSGKPVFQKGDTQILPDDPDRTIEAVYELPLQAHATPEPMNCTAHVKPDGCQIWAPTQNQDGAQEAAARITGLAYDRITVNTPFMGGGFGRRVSVDYVIEAVELSKAVNAPVKVIWTREEDMQNDHFRPASMALMRATLDGNNRPTAWLHRIVGPDHMTHQLPGLLPTILPYGVPRMVRNLAGSLARTVLPRVVAGKKAIEGAAPLIYGVDDVTVEFVHDDPGIPLGFWRSVAYSQNVFYVESFMDEIAAHCGQDPLDQRLSLLAHDPRLQAVLRRVAEKSKWRHKAADGMYQGLAACNFHGARLAAVAGITIREGGRIRVRRVDCAVDCGRVIHPGIVVDQITGGIVFGLTAALKSRITMTRGRVDQRNFDTFALLRMDETPEINVHLVGSAHPPTGIGEAAVPLAGPALANAVYAATGKRIRHLPIWPENLTDNKRT